MSNSIVNIESLDENNKSFGTGFVIDTDEKGVYILTCQHVIDDVKTPMVEEVKARVIATNNFIDMAVLYVSKLQRTPLSLQIDPCESLEVEVIGFSHFNKNLNQKKHIQATLYQESIELHSTKDDSFYIARKIKANEGYNFDRGNSGSPVICKKSEKVIAMISNKEGSDIGYAIDIISLQDIWAEMPQKLLQKEEIEKDISNPQEEVLQKESSPTIKKKSVIKNFITKSNKINMKMNLIANYLFVALILGIGTYAYIASGDHRPPPPQFQKQHPTHQKPIPKNDLQQATRLEYGAFEALIAKDFNQALNFFEQAEQSYNGFHNVYEITKILRKNKNSLENRSTQVRIVKLILQHPGASPRDLLKRLRESFRIRKVQ